MGKTITIDDNAYQLLSSLKRGTGDSFTKVILRHVNRPADTGGELAELIDRLPPPDVDMEMLERIRKERGRRSGGRKSMTTGSAGSAATTASRSLAWTQPPLTGYRGCAGSPTKSGNRPELNRGIRG